MARHNYLSWPGSPGAPLNPKFISELRGVVFCTIYRLGLEASLLFPGSDFRCNVCTPAGIYRYGRVGLCTEFNLPRQWILRLNTRHKRQQQRQLCWSFLYVYFFQHTKKHRDLVGNVRYQKTDRAREFTYKKSARDLKFLCGTEMINLFCFNFQDP